jgi:hypothetical protein
MHKDYWFLIYLVYLAYYYNYLFVAIIDPNLESSHWKGMQVEAIGHWVHLATIHCKNQVL